MRRLTKKSESVLVDRVDYGAHPNSMHAYISVENPRGLSQRLLPDDITRGEKVASGLRINRNNVRQNSLSYSSPPPFPPLPPPPPGALTASAVITCNASNMQQNIVPTKNQGERSGHAHVRISRSSVASHNTNPGTRRPTTEKRRYVTITPPLILHVFVNMHVRNLL